MKIQKYSTWLALPLVALFWVGAANASTVIPGIAVGGGGTSFTTEIEPTVNGKTKYYIPLRDQNNGTYGVTPVSECGSWPKVNGIAGTCWDKGYGSGYDDADALQMNIFFDLTGVADSADATLDFVFDDLDLQRINDPTGFFESLTLSYWDGSAYQQLNDGSTIFRPSDMTTGDYAGASTVIAPSIDPLLWTLDLGAGGLNLLSLLNNDDDGFWIQLGFGSKYLDEHGNPKKGWNTPEQLTASLTVSPVPLPSAVWLFGSALLGFIGMSRRTRV